MSFRLPKEVRLYLGKSLNITKSITDLGKKPRLTWQPISFDYDNIGIYRYVEARKWFCQNNDFK